MRIRPSVPTVFSGGIGTAAFVILALAAPLVAGQIRSDDRGGNKDPDNLFGVDWKKGDAPLAGEAREDAWRRILSYKPEPERYPIPRTPWDKKPFFGGVWWPGGAVAKRALVPLESLYRKDPAVQARRESTELANWRDGYSNPGFHCIPGGHLDGGFSRLLSTQIVHGPDIMSVFTEAGAYRLIRVDERPRNTRRAPSYLGDSLARWDGDTLVVETTNFKDGLWLGGAQGNRPPQTASDALRIVQRWTILDGRMLEYTTTVYDEKMLTGPWTGPTIRVGRTGDDAGLEADPCFEDPELVRMEKEYQEKKGR